MSLYDRSIPFAVLSLLAAVAPCRGQPAPTEGDSSPPVAKAAVVKLTLYPAALPVPAMRYQLLPSVSDLTPGNAALLYQRAHSPEWWVNFYRSGETEKMTDWLEMPLRKMPREKVVLLKGPLEEMDRAARREFCDWELTPRLREDGFALLLPDLHGFRTFGRMIALRTRLDILDGNHGKAVHSLQTGFALSRHLADAPILINALVGMAVGHLMVQQLEDYVQQENAPNLYWALADLPRPFIDLRRPFQGERIGTDGMFGEIRAALNDPSHPPVPVSTIKKYVEKLTLFGVGTGDNPLSFALMAARAYPEAEQYLASHGWSAAQIKQLPVTQTALMYAVALFDEFFDDTYKWHNFPYWQAGPMIQKADKEFTERLREHREAMYLASVLVPAVSKVSFAKARLERALAMMQVVEALRHHAAATGKLPEHLEDIRSVPVPLDPVHGKAFEYRRDGTRAILYSAPPEGEPATERHAVRYELSLAATTKK